MILANREKKKTKIEIPEYSSLTNNPDSKFILTWENIDLKITVRKNSKICSKKTKELHILKNISGFAKSGECLAIMGGSGSGKSVLLNILSNQFQVKKNMKLKGNVKLNGRKMEFKKYKNIIGFFLQSDFFLSTLKIEELFKFVVDLKHVNYSEKKKKNIIDTMIRNLKLEKARKNIVGGNFEKGISGGEKRRLNIGFELLKEPKILFLDEPSSGLDSYTGYIIVKLLKRIAKEHNILIIYSIHQPTIDMGNLIDKLLILNKGKLSYFGKRNEIEQYYSNLGFKCSIDVNPLDYVIEVALIGGPEADNIFFEEFKNKGSLDNIKKTISNIPHKEIDYKVKKAGSWQQFKILSKLAFTNFIRNPLTVKIRLVQVIFISLMFLLLYWQMDDISLENTTAIRNRSGALFFLSINLFILYFQSSLTTFPKEREIFLKEYNSGLYGIIPYYFSKMIIEIPLTSFFPFLFSCIIYHAVNFNPGVSNFFLFILGALLISNCASLMGVFIGTIITKSAVVIDIAPLVFFPFFIFGGFTTNTDSILNFLKFFEYLSPVRYTFEYFIRNEFEDYSEELGSIGPVESLNFNMSILICFFVLLGYSILLMVLSLMCLKIKSKNIQN